MADFDRNEATLRNYLNSCRQIRSGITVDFGNETDMVDKLQQAIERSKPEALWKLVKDSNATLSGQMESLLTVVAYDRGLREPEFLESVPGLCMAYWDAGDLIREDLTADAAVERMTFELKRLIESYPENLEMRLCARLLSD